MTRRNFQFTPNHRGGAGSPMVCLHGFLDTWRTWELVLPALERRHDVFAPTLPGHAGGPELAGNVDTDALVDGVERAMADAGIERAHLIGKSLGGHLALRLAERGRAMSVVAFAPAGGWAEGDPACSELLEFQRSMWIATRSMAFRAHEIASTLAGRRQATRLMVERSDHLSAEFVEHLIRGVAASDAALALIDHALVADWHVRPEAIKCPVRIAWGTADRLLAWPSAAARLRKLLPHADWIELDGVGHAPQLDVPLETAELILGFTA